MSQSAEHCPFLNRSDSRCSEHFNLERLQHAYKFCFGSYESCPRYQQLLNERQHRRDSAGAAVGERQGSDDNHGVPTVLVQIAHHAGTARRRAVA